MGILDRVNRIVRSNLNQLLDRAEDPQKSLELHIEEMRSGVGDARRELLHLAAAEKLARRKYEDCADEAKVWEERAAIALRAGDEGLARQALIYKREVDAKAQDYLRQATLSAEYVDQLRAQIEMLERKNELAKQRAREIAARRAHNEVEEAYARRQARREPRPVDTIPLENTSSFDEFDRVDDRISQLDAEMEALAELNADLFQPQRAELEQRFKELERDDSVREGLDALRRRLRD